MQSGEATPLLVNHRSDGEAGFDSNNTSRYVPSTTTEIRGTMTHKYSCSSWISSDIKYSIDQGYSNIRPPWPRCNVNTVFGFVTWCTSILDESVPGGVAPGGIVVGSVDELPPPYTSITGGAPMVTCRVCQVSHFDNEYEYYSIDGIEGLRQDPHSREAAPYKLFLF